MIAHPWEKGPDIKGLSLLPNSLTAAWGPRRLALISLHIPTTSFSGGPGTEGPVPCREGVPVEPWGMKPGGTLPSTPPAAPHSLSRHNRAWPRG